MNIKMIKLLNKIRSYLLTYYNLFCKINYKITTKQKDE